MFDRNNEDFQYNFTKNPEGTEYPDVFEADLGRIGNCYTDSNGECIAGLESTGDILIIVKYVDNKTVYTGRPAGVDDFEDTDNDNIDDLVTKEFQIIKVIQKDSTIDFKAGSKTVLTGSLLEIINPQYTIWENYEELYPFLFISEGAWEVDVCVNVPQGYRVVDGDCNQVFAADEAKDILFVVEEIGSPEPKVKTKMKIKHKGKSENVDLDIPGKRKKNRGPKPDRPEFDSADIQEKDQTQMLIKP